MKPPETTNDDDHINSQPIQGGDDKLEDSVEEKGFAMGFDAIDTNARKIKTKQKQRRTKWRGRKQQQTKSK